MTYLWRIPNEYPESLIGEYDKKCSPDRFLFVQGKRIGQPASIPSFTFAGEPEALMKYDILPNNTMVPLVSERVARILRGLCPDDIELITANIIAFGEKILGFNLVNILPQIASVDYEGSSFKCIPGTKQIMKFSQLKLKPNVLGAHHLARAVEFNSFILASEKLRLTFNSEHVMGLGFVLPEAFKP